jgi:hypothetical protein
LAKKVESRENLYGMNVPRGSFALSGGQFAQSLPASNGKKPTDGPPMIITDSPPGVYDDDWARTFGASRDAYLTLVNGAFLQTAMDEVSINGIYREGSVNAITDNLWKPAETIGGNVQQVQYIVSKESLDAASSAIESFGEINEARGIGLRVPTIAGGYGRTIDGLPTDPEPTDDPQKRKNDEAHKVARETWKYGPIEYRWDYRKGVWSAYNELIADHEGEDLGTWVFSTNPDTEDGFPFLRGRLEDVWWVRRTFDLKDTDGTVQGVKTGEIMTHLNHRWFDEDEEGAARLSSIFIIPHTQSAHEEGDDEGCHFKAEDEQELGDEVTADCDRIDIKTEVHFFKEKGIDGPVKFGRSVSDLEDDLCCYNPRAKHFIGEMIFLDEPVEVCTGSAGGGGGGVAIVEDSEAETCKWVPSVQIDECQLMGEHMVKLVDNDQNIAGRISDVCNMYAQFTSDLADVLDENNAAIMQSLECINLELKGIAASANAAFMAFSMTTNKVIAEKFAEVYSIIDQVIAAVESAFLQCASCEVNITYQVDGDNGMYIGEVPSIIADDCPVPLLALAPTIDCNECYGVEIMGPCTTQESFMAGEACSTYVPRDIETEYGECGSHGDTA